MICSFFARAHHSYARRRFGGQGTARAGFSVETIVGRPMWRTPEAFYRNALQFFGLTALGDR